MVDFYLETPKEPTQRVSSCSKVHGAMDTHSYHVSCDALSEILGEMLDAAIAADELTYRIALYGFALMLGRPINETNRPAVGANFDCNLE